MRVLGGVVALSVAVLAGCAAPGADGVDGTPPLTWDGDLDLGVPGELIIASGGVEYYPACGNEVLDWAEDDYYPFKPADTEGFPDPSNHPPLDVEPSATAAAATLPERTGDAALGFARASALRTAHVRTVAEPGPGDDVGTLVVYDNGFAHWTSDSGRLETWLTTTPIEYQWAC
ncbi:hypothetical protein [Demequina sp. NBRC 110056]|uniref:hypothetical protein n=1 Tax=Demequina sp. NBRC 110056 TaxID=1570345 RepID=UPI0013563DFB|nr:hypothetical protein [Demequina sp. NBRC 110056]